MVRIVRVRYWVVSPLPVMENKNKLWTILFAVKSFVHYLFSREVLMQSDSQTTIAVAEKSSSIEGLQHLVLENSDTTTRLISFV